MIEYIVPLVNKIKSKKNGLSRLFYAAQPEKISRRNAQ